MNLGTKNKMGDMPVAAPSSPDKPKTSYPSFTLNDDVAKKFMEHYKLELNDECDVDARIRLTGLRDDQYGTAVTLDVLSIDHEGEGDEADEEGEKDSEKKSKRKEYENPAVEKLEM